MVENSLIRWALTGRDYETLQGMPPSFIATSASMDEASIFHSSIPGYSETPLHSLRSLAENIGISQVLVKDESLRFGLNAFKSLGGSFAVAKWLYESSDIAEPPMTFEKVRALGSGKGKVFVTATDGNHGRAVAWAARMMGAQAMVFMPKGSAQARVEAIRQEGAQVWVTDCNYDDAVNLAAEHAEKNRSILIQDTAFGRYLKEPRWIMQGYLTIMSEISKQLAAMGNELPTHVILQAGVGSFAASMIAGLKVVSQGKMPTVIIAEPENAACLFASAVHGEGKPVRVKGNLETIMAGLACGEPNPIAWEIIGASAAAFASCDDEVAEIGMSTLAYPFGDDDALVSGESGAVGAGIIRLLMEQESASPIRRALNIGKSSRVLLISTEGATDPVGYRRAIERQRAKENA